jgi:hypothetical protein
LRGTFGTVGTIVRARRRATIYSTRARSNSSVNGGARSTDDQEKNGVRFRNRVMSGASLASSAIADHRLTSPGGATPSVAEEEPTMSQLLTTTPLPGSPEGLTRSLSAGQTPQPPNKKVSIEAFTTSQYSPIKHKRSEPTPPSTPGSTARGFPQRTSTAPPDDPSSPSLPKAPNIIINNADATIKASQAP